MPVIQPVRGTRDFYPEDMAFRTWLYEKIRAVSERYGYQEYDGPYLERLDLYAAKSGALRKRKKAFRNQDSIRLCTAEDPNHSENHLRALQDP